MMPLASRGGDHRKDAEVLVIDVTVKLVGAVDSEIRGGKEQIRRTVVSSNQDLYCGQKQPHKSGYLTNLYTFISWACPHNIKIHDYYLLPVLVIKESSADVPLPKSLVANIVAV